MDKSLTEAFQRWLQLRRRGWAAQDTEALVKISEEIVTAHDVELLFKRLAGLLGEVLDFDLNFQLVISIVGQ